MFIRETYAKEFIDEYIKEHINLFQKEEDLYIYKLSEQGINLLEIFDKYGVKVKGFIDDNPHVLHKTICGKYVYGTEEKIDNYYIIVSSPSTAWHDQKVLESKGFHKEKTYAIFPAVTRHYALVNLGKDKERYAGRTKAENDQMAKRELDEKTIETEAITTQLILDLTAKCNLNCRHCDAHHRPEISKIRNLEEDYTPFERYQFLLDYADFVYLNISGEPLMTKRFWELLDYVDASDNQPELFTITNGILLDEKASNRIVDSKFQSIFISMDGASKLTYKRLRGGDFDLWYKNVKYLSERRTAVGKNLEIVLQHTVSREALEETKRAVEIAEELGVNRIIIRPLYEEIAGKENWLVPMDEERDYFYMQQMTSNYPNITQKIMDEVREYAKTVNVKVEISDRFDANSNDGQEDIPYPIPVEEFKERFAALPKVEKVIEEVPELAKDYPLCNQPWNLTLFYVNGRVMHCNRMVQMEGNINFSTLHELHNNKLAQDIRRGLKEDHLNWTCYHCSGCVRSDYEKHLEISPYYMKRGESILFDLEETAVLRELNYSGISRIQRDGAWNNLRESEIEFYLNKEDKEYELSLTAEAFVIPGLVESQRVEVFVNENEAGIWVFDKSDKAVNTVQIKKEWMNDEDRIALKFVYPDAVSPLQFGLGRDDRERAIFIKEIQVR
jgi:MoaA/NifB/PqqE/SkfB family radical SAM enzyme